MKRAENYEEAKIILQNSVGSEYDKKFSKALRNRAIFNTTAALSFGAAMGLATSSSLAFMAFLPATGIVLALSIVPIIIKNKMNNNIKSGKYFETKSKKDIISEANGYVDQVNDYEYKQEMKGKSR